MKKVTIIGAGLVGTLCAIYLAKRGYQVIIYESRKDPRLFPAHGGRSVNLAMSCRGLTGLAGAGLLPAVIKLMVPMRGRVVHDEKGTSFFQPFGRQNEEYINAIQRTDLNNLLLQQADLSPQIQVFFDAALHSLNLDKKQITLKLPRGEYKEATYELLIGADGAGSLVRESMLKKGVVQSHREFLPYGYKELSICNQTSNAFVKEHLHLWPRNSVLLLGNPNLDTSITGSLFMPKEGKLSFANLDTELKVQHFFKEMFPDACEFMPHLMEEMHDHPIGNMSTVICSPWHYEDHCLLLGDAAHGIIPFFGQGMNSGFEDCRILNELLENYDDEWAKVMAVFYALRKPNTEAVSKMSMDNYHEIHSGICDPQFNLKKELHHELMIKYPDTYQSMHVLVMFTNVGYALAQKVGEIQKVMLNKICLNKQSIAEIDWDFVKGLMVSYENDIKSLT